MLAPLSMAIRCCTAQPLTLHVALQARNAECTGRLRDAAGVVEYVLDGGADLVCADQHHLVHQLAGDSEGLLADLAHRHAVREQSHLVQLHPLAGGQRTLQGRRLRRLYADDLDLGTHVLHVSSNPGDQAASAHRNEDRMGRLGVLAKDLHGNGALARDHIRVVEGVDEGQTLFLDDLHRVRVCLVVGIPVQHGLRTQVAHCLHLDGRSGPRHDDGRLRPQPRCAQSDPLGVVARGGGDHSALERCSVQMGQLVVGPAQLEGEHGLQVLALEKDFVAEPPREVVGAGQRRLSCHIVDAGTQDPFDIGFRHRA